MTAGKNLRLDLYDPARVKSTVGRKSQETATEDSGIKMHTVLLPLAGLKPGATVRVFVEPAQRGGDVQPDKFLVRIREGNGNGCTA